MSAVLIMTTSATFLGNFVGNFVESLEDSSDFSTKFTTKFPTRTPAVAKMRIAVGCRKIWLEDRELGPGDGPKMAFMNF